MIIVYDITDKESFNNSKLWIQDIKNKYERLPTQENTLSIMLVGNKIDQENEREVTYEKGKKLAGNISNQLEKKKKFFFLSLYSN